MNIPLNDSLFGGRDYNVPGDLLRTGLFGLGLSVPVLSSLLAVTIFAGPQMLLRQKQMMSTWELTK